MYKYTVHTEKSTKSAKTKERKKKKKKEEEKKTQNAGNAIQNAPKENVWFPIWGQNSIVKKMRKLVFQHQTQIEQVLHIYPWDKSGEYNCRNSYDVRR